jgi:hypothetical protein
MKRVSCSRYCSTFGLLVGDTNLLPIVIPPISLRELGVEVDEVACEEEVVLRGDGHGVTHEGGRVDC